MSWQELFPKYIKYGRYDYQVWVNKNKYTIERYIPATEDTPREHENTALSGVLYQCETREQQITQILEDIRGLADEIEDEFNFADHEEEEPLGIDLSI